MDGLKNFVSSGALAEGAIRGIKTALEELFFPLALVGGSLKDIIESLPEIGKIVDEEGVGGLIGKIAEAWKTGWDLALHHQETFTDDSKREMGRYADDLVGHSIIPDMIDDILDEFDRLMKDGPKVLIKGLPSFKEVGKSLVEGIRQGIEDAWDNFLSWLVGQMGSIIDAIMAAIGAGSPATKAEPIGTSLAGGVLVGWDDEFARVRSSIVGDVVGMLGGGQALASGGRLAQPEYATATVGGGRNVQIFNIYDQAAMGLALALVNQQRGARLDAFMGG